MAALLLLVAVVTGLTAIILSLRDIGDPKAFWFCLMTVVLLGLSYLAEPKIGILRVDPDHSQLATQIVEIRQDVHTLQTQVAGQAPR